MPNIGEEIVGAYLQVIKSCSFVQYNVPTGGAQGEIDVLGIDIHKRTVYVCEVAIHLITGLQYTRQNQPDNVQRLVNKFRKDMDYVSQAFQGYDHVFMLWSPIVKNQRAGTKHNQLRDVAEIKQKLLELKGIDLQVIINEAFHRCLSELRAYAADQTVELRSPVLRFLQIEGKLARHLKVMKSSNTALTDSQSQEECLDEW
jgi:hypothetical protein